MPCCYENHLKFYSLKTTMAYISIEPAFLRYGIHSNKGVIFLLCMKPRRSVIKYEFGIRIFKSIPYLTFFYKK